MAKQIISVGTTPNDKTGDPLRTAFIKTNSNFTEVYDALAALLPFNGGTITNALHISDTTDSATSHTLGSLTTAGGIGVAKNANIHGVLYLGAGADASTLSAPTLIAKATGAQYIQAAIINSDARGSSDWVAYGDLYTETTGWVDMGFTGSQFNDPNYTITETGEGYIFVSGYPDGISHGSLVLATNNTGINNDIVFGTGGFFEANERIRLTHNTQQFDVYMATESTSTITGSITTAGGIGVAKNINVGGHVGFADGSTQSSASISKTTLKTIVAASTSFADFQSRIAAL